MRPFVSLEPEIIVARVAHALNVPVAHVAAPDAAGVVRLHGEVAYGTWLKLEKTRSTSPASTLPGVSAIDTSALHYTNQARIEAACKDLRDLTIPFASGNAVPDTGWEAALDRMSVAVKELQQLGGRDVGFLIQTAGLTDGSGNPVHNAQLRLRRAQWLADQLQDAVQAPSRVEVSQRVAEQAADPDQRGARAIATPFPIEDSEAKDAR